MNINNNCFVLGRMVKDPDLRVTQNGNSQLQFNVAVQRAYKNQSGQYETDFITCIAFGKTADTIAKYFRKGSRIILHGEWRTGSYSDRNGNKVYTNQLHVADFGFVDSKKDQENAGMEQPAEQQSKRENDIPDFMAIPEGMEAELPFV